MMDVLWTTSLLGRVNLVMKLLQSTLENNEVGALAV